MASFRTANALVQRFLANRANFHGSLNYSMLHLLSKIILNYAGGRNVSEPLFNHKKLRQDMVFERVYFADIQIVHPP